MFIFDIENNLGHENFSRTRTSGNCTKFAFRRMIHFQNKCPISRTLPSDNLRRSLAHLLSRKFPKFLIEKLANRPPFLLEESPNFLVARKPGRMSNESQTIICVCVCHSIIPRKYAIKTPFLLFWSRTLIIAYGNLSPPLRSGKIEIKRKFVEEIRSWNGWWCWFCKCFLQLQHRSLSTPCWCLHNFRSKFFA